MHQYGPQNDWSRMKRGAPEEIGVKSSPSSSNSAPEARQQAGAEGLTLLLSESSTSGFQGEPLGLLRAATERPRHTRQ